MTGDGQIRDAFCRLSPQSLLTVGREGNQAGAWELGCNDRADSGAVRCAERTAGQAGLGCNQRDGRFALSSKPIQAENSCSVGCTFCEEVRARDAILKILSVRCYLKPCDHERHLQGDTSETVKDQRGT